MNLSVVKYVDEAGVHNAIIDNPWGGDTHITSESAAALDMAINREREFIAFVEGGSRISEPVLPLDIESAFERDNLMDCID